MIKTFSQFNYGFDVTIDNCFLDVDENGILVLAEVEFGNYTIGEGLQAVEDALNAAGHRHYTVSINRTTMIVTIAADNDFDLLLSSGGSAASSIFTLLGFQQGTDLTGTDTYSGSVPCGTTYSPQFVLQNYVPPENFRESIDATVNRSADGRVEVVTFGQEQKIEMDIMFITNRPMDDVVILNNPSGLEDAIDFLTYIAQKKRFEFVPDVDAPGTLHKVILESYPGYSKGTGFKLKELITRNLPDIFETGVMQLRVVT